MASRDMGYYWKMIYFDALTMAKEYEISMTTAVPVSGFAHLLQTLDEIHTQLVNIRENTSDED